MGESQQGVLNLKNVQIGYLIVIAFSLRGFCSSWNEPGHENSLWLAILLLSFSNIADSIVYGVIRGRQSKELENRIAKFERKDSATQC
jgi:hypothetical protein